VFNRGNSAFPYIFRSYVGRSSFCRPKFIGVKKKIDRREAVRERKALSAAHVERSIEKELIERLRSKAYGDAPLNVHESIWKTILDRKTNEDRSETQPIGLRLVDDETDEEMEQDVEDEWGDQEFVSDLSEGEGEGDGLSDLEEVAVSLPQSSFM
jgi:protein MAK16